MTSLHFLSRFEKQRFQRISHLFKSRRRNVAFDGRRTLGLWQSETCEQRVLLTTPIFINEFHYDDTGADANEFVEVAGPAGTELDGYLIALYDGATGSNYKTIELKEAIPDQDDGVGTLVFYAEGILDSVGGMALVDDQGSVLQFLSYEGAFTATDGPAQSMMSTDIGLDEDPAVSEGLSLSLQGAGGAYEDFLWGVVTATPGAKNNGQNLYPEIAPSVITVTTAVDENDGHLDSTTGTGVSLREAIIAANENPNLNTIIFDASLNGTPIQLTLGGGDDVAAVGDLDITSPVSIVGNGIANTTISAGADIDDLANTPGIQDRIFDVTTNGTLSLNGLGLTGGNSGTGGAILARNSGALNLTDTRVFGNYTSSGGGGLSIFLDSVVSIMNSTIEDNRAQGTGGGIFSRGQITMTSSTLSGNEAGTSGGGIFQNQNGVFNTELSTISGNTATDSGGGIYANTPGTVNLRTTTVSDNMANFGAGLFSRATVLIRDSTLSGNQASESGGGAHFATGTVKIINSTVSSNTAGSLGGGVYNEAATVTARNATIAMNVAMVAGGGISLGSSTSGDTFSLFNTIVAGNTKQGSTQSDIEGDDVHAASAYNIVTDSFLTAGGMTNGQNGNQIGRILTFVIDPALIDNGGPTQTHRAVGFAIDRGSNALALDENDQPLATDQRGELRRRLDVVDIGAMEGTSTSIGVTTAADVVDQFDGVVSLREAIVAANSTAEAATISFDASLDGTPIVLSRSGINEDESVSGDLDVSSDITIVGRGRTNTIIDGGADIDDIANTPGIGEAVFHVLSGASLHVDAVTITGGNRVASSGSNVNGGGIYSSGSVVTIVNSEVSRNLGYRGGGVHSDHFLTITDSVIANNQAHTGGGIHSSRRLTLLGTTVSHNISQALGGGIYARRTQFYESEIRQSTISENTAGTNGGGIAVDVGLIIDSTLWGNTSQSGGGVYALGEDADLTVINSTISGNSANYNAGGIGLISLDPQRLRVVNSTIYANRAGTGAGIRLSSNSTATIDNSIIAGGENGSDIQIYFGTTLTGTHNIIEDGQNLGSLTNTITGDPMLGTLADNGGPTLTHAPVPNSPALNRGNNNKAVDENLAPLSTDQRGSGFDRIITRVDIGAFEGFIDPRTSIVGFTNGNWWLTRPDGSGDYTTAVAASGPASSFRKVLTGDFNGDGIDDLACWLNNGEWRVGLGDSEGNFTFSTWTTWTHPSIKEIHVGDFNDDGLDDIIGLFEIPNRNRGRWWVGVSDGDRFANRSWGDFGNFSGLLDVAVGNFDGVKGDDLALITATGNIFMVKTSNSSFQYLFSHNWSVNSGFNFFQAGDFNGDGRDDLVAVFGNGADKSIFVAKSLGPATGFASLKFADLTATQSFDSFVVGDFNGDGKDDVAARLNTTKWWLGLAGVNVFNFTFGTTWSFASNGVHDIHVGSTNGDANSDILGRDSNGNWYSAEANGTSLVNRVVETWASVNWQYVNGGDYSTPPAAPPSLDGTFSPQAAIQTTDVQPDLAKRWSAPAEPGRVYHIPSDSVQLEIGLEHRPTSNPEDYRAFGEEKFLDLLFDA